MKVKKLFVFGATALMAMGVVACSSNPGTEHLKDAADYLFQMYREEPAETGSSYKRVSTLILEYATYTVDWSVEVTAGSTEAVKIGETANNYTTIEIFAEKATEKTDYTLTASIAYEGKAIEKEFKYYIPKYVPAVSVSDFLEAKDTTKSIKIQGVLTYVNGAKFVLDDGKNSIYCHSGIDATKIKLGDEVIIAGTYSEYNGTPQIDKPEFIESLATGKQGETLKKRTLLVKTPEELLADLAGQDKSMYNGTFIKISGGYLVKDGYVNLYKENDSKSTKLANMYAPKELNLDGLSGKKVDVYGYAAGAGSYLTFHATHAVEFGTPVEF